MVTIFSFGQMTSENREWRHTPYTSFCPCLWQSCFAHFRKVEDLVSKIYIACLIYRENSWKFVFNDSQITSFKPFSIWRDYFTMAHQGSLTNFLPILVPLILWWMYVFIYRTCHISCLMAVHNSIEWDRLNLSLTCEDPLASCLKIVDKLNTGCQRLFSWVVQTWFVV